MSLVKEESLPSSGLFISCIKDYSWNVRFGMSDSIKEAIIAKRDLELLILDKLQEFEASYGVYVQSVSLAHDEVIGSRRHVADVSVAVEL